MIQETTVDTIILKVKITLLSTKQWLGYTFILD